MEGPHKRANLGARNPLPPYLAIFKAIWLGLVDSILGIGSLFTHRPQERPSSSKRQEDVALNRIYKCCLLNGGVFGVSYSLRR